MLATRFQRARQEVEARQRVAPLLASFFLGWAAARVCYPWLRSVIWGGALGPLKTAVLQAHRAPSASCWNVTGSPFGFITALVTLAAGVMSLLWLMREHRRQSVTKSLLRNRLYRLSLLAFAASFFVWLSGAGSPMKLAECLLAVAGLAVVAAAWPRWRLGTRLAGVALFALASGFALVMGYYVDSLVLKGN